MPDLGLLRLAAWAYSRHREVNKMSEATPHHEEDPIDDEKIPDEPDVNQPISPVLARLIEEVRNENVEDPHAYNRMHNRHNRSR